MAMISCPECGAQVSDKAKSCPSCGYSFEETKFCKYCGEKIPADSIICTKCGRQVENTRDGGVIINNIANAASSATAKTPTTVGKTKEVNKIIALVLCIFLGGFGAHKFYEGKIGMGILYILTVGLFGIGWFVDIIIIALKPNPYYV